MGRSCVNSKVTTVRRKKRKKLTGPYSSSVTDSSNIVTLLYSIDMKRESTEFERLR